VKIGAMELVVIFIVALLVIGPDKLPQYARKFGVALREFKKASSDVTQEIRESVIDPLEEAQKPLREAMEPLEDLNREVKSNLRGVENDLKNVGKAKPKTTEEPAKEPAVQPAAAEAPQPESPAAQTEPEQKNEGGETP